MDKKENFRIKFWKIEIIDFHHHLSQLIICEQCLHLGWATATPNESICFAFFVCFGPDLTQIIGDRKAKLSAHAFYPFLFPIARHLTFAPNVFFHICKIIKSPPNRLGNGEELWAAISERTFVIYCHWPESTFPETGERLFLASNFFLRLIFSIRFATFSPFWERGGGASLKQYLQKKVPNLISSHKA